MMDQRTELLHELKNIAMNLNRVVDLLEKESMNVQGRVESVQTPTQQNLSAFQPSNGTTFNYVYGQPTSHQNPSPNMQANVQAQGVAMQGQSVPNQRFQPQGVAYGQAWYPNQQPKPKPAPKPKKPLVKPNFEFRIGANVLAVVGVLFVIVALVTFGITMLPSSAQGAFLYLIFIALIPLSELLVKKRNEKFSVVLTSLGIIGLYASTIVNYMFTGLLNDLSAIIVSVIVSAVAVFLSRKRDSIVMRLILHLGVFACFYPYGGQMTTVSYAMMSLLVLLINITSVFVPVKTNKHIADIVQISTYTLFTFCFLWYGRVDVYLFVHMLPIVFTMGVGQLLHIRETKKDKRSLTAIYICHGLLLFASMVLFGMQMTRWDNDSLDLTLYLVISALPLLVTGIYNYVKRYESYMRLDVFMIQMFWVLATLLMSARFYDVYAKFLAFVFIMASFGVSFWQYQKHDYKWRHIVVSGFSMLWMTWFIVIEYFDQRVWIILAIAVFLSLFLQYSYQTLFVTGFTVFCVANIAIMDLLSDFWGERKLELAIINIVIAAMIYFVSKRENLQDKGTETAYKVALVYALMNNTQLLVFDYSYVVYLIFLMSSLFMILYVIKTEYGFKRLNRYLVMMIYLTFMVFVLDVELPIVISICLMVLAIASVVFGSFVNVKVVRMYGLGLALLTYAKIALYDFAEVGDVSRITVFLVAGLLAIAISFVYSYLEKKEKQETGRHEKTEGN